MKWFYRFDVRSRFLLSDMFGLVGLACCSSGAIAHELGWKTGPLAAWPGAIVPRVVLIGDTHGTREIPQYALRLIQDVSYKSPLVIAVELAPDTADLDCESYGTRLPKSWNSADSDGRTSISNARLVCGLQKLQRAGRIRLLYLDNIPRVKDFDSAAARKITAAMTKQPNAGVIVLAGNYHTRSDGGSIAASLKEAGIDVATATVSSASMVNTAWQCQKDGCGIHAVKMDFCPGDNSKKDVYWSMMSNGQWNYCLNFPKFTASAPVPSN